MATKLKVISHEQEPTDFLEECREWQAGISGEQNPEFKDIVGLEACRALRGQANFNGSKHGIVRTQAAFVISIAKQQSETGKRTMLQFPGATFMGTAGNVEYTRFGSQGLLSITLYDATALVNEVPLHPQELEELLDEEPDVLAITMPGNRPIKLPIHMPVPAIEFAMCGPERVPYRHSDRVLDAAVERGLSEMLDAELDREIRDILAG